MAAAGNPPVATDAATTSVPSTMTAITYAEYGGPAVLDVATVPVPTPRDDEVLIRVQAASVNAGDWHLMRGTPWFIRLLYGGYVRPRHPILGVDVAGRIEAVGSTVADVPPGAEVIADLSGHGFGGFAEYVCVPSAMVVSKPATVSMEDAATLPTAAVAALQALRDAGRPQRGDAVLVNGASGGVGTFAVQLAQSLGATVTAVCSQPKMALVRSIGADRVIDYAQEDFTTAGDRYDLIVDTAGSHSIREIKRALLPGGRYVMVGGPFGRFIRAMVLGPIHSRLGTARIRGFTVRPNPDDLATVAELVGSGAITPIIDRRYPLDAVPEAIRYLEPGRATGKVVVTVEDAPYPGSSTPG